MPEIKIKKISLEGLNKEPVPLEDNECFEFAAYLKEKNIRFSHIPNETFTRNRKTKKKNKMLGVNKGVPDYIIIIEREGTEKAGPRNNILIFIEMKRTKGGKVSPEQAGWINALNKVFGVVAVVAKGFKEAKDIIDAYIPQS